ncbi:MAG: MBL fold metallo-hydrolase [Candidatus Hodarchaeota archaeon]
MKIEPNVFLYAKGKENKYLHSWSGLVYAVKQPDDTFFLIDSGMFSKRKLKLFEEDLERDGLNLKDLRAILITHAHADHTRSTPLIIEKHPKCEVWVHEKDAGILSDPNAFWDLMLAAGKALKSDFIPFGAGWLAKFFMKLILGTLPAIKPDRLLKDGEMIGKEGGEIKVIHTPGHSPGHAGYYLINQEILFTGDIIDPAFDSKPVTNTPSANFKELRASLVKMKEIKPKVLLTSHGDDGINVIRGKERVQKFIQKSIDNMDKAYQAVVNLLEDRKRVKFKEFKDIIDEKIWDSKFERLTTALSVLKELKEKGMVIQEGKEFQYIK